MTYRTVVKHILIDQKVIKHCDIAYDNNLYSVHKLLIVKEKYF